MIALRRARTEGFNYGWPRGIGSAAYVVGNVAMGFVLGLTAPDAMLVWIVIAAVGCGGGGAVAAAAGSGARGRRARCRRGSG